MAAQEQWEYRTVNLYRGTVKYDEQPQMWEKLSADLKTVGEEGWEAVGQVDVTWSNMGRTDSTRAAQLLFKRRRSVS